MGDDGRSNVYVGMMDNRRSGTHGLLEYRGILTRLIHTS